MGALIESPESEQEELHLLSDWSLGDDHARRRRAAMLSVAVHVVAIIILTLLPQSAWTPSERRLETRRRVTPLVAPLFYEPTQRAPNKAKISKSFDEQSLRPRPSIQLPKSPPSTTRPAAVAPGVPEPPRIEAAENRTAPKFADPLPGPPVPQPQTTPTDQKSPAPPKIALENPGGAPEERVGPGKLAAPSASVSEAVRDAARRGPSGGLMVGDSGSGVGGVGEALNLPPAPGKVGSALELLSDPMGVDFRPYLVKILASVRRNWWAVMPESAKLGRRGRVAIQFSIDREGRVPKLVIVAPSGADALDRAAIAGISASNPFPPLPNEYRGNQIRLQFNFSYNMPAN